ncbi:MAG: hypothetical protein IJF25_00970, partial [Oscillospiraceae bacterium]|nr:hypothetical protein [Oscillospiraceae bacterium]
CHRKEAKLLYRKSLKIFCGATAAAAILRALLKVLYIDLETGFYIGGGVLVYLLPVVIIAGAAGIVFFAYAEKSDSAGLLRGNRFIEITMTLLGLAVCGVSALRLPKALAISSKAVLVNCLPKWLQVAEHALGMISGFVFLYLAFCLISGAKSSGIHGMAALIPAIWQTIAMVDRFISFREVATASDQLIETLYLVCATLFLLANARCLAGMAKSRRRCVIWGLLASHLGLVLAAGQVAAVVVLGSDISGPPMLQNILILAFSVYAVSLSASLALSNNE